MVKGILRFNLTGTALGVSNHISVIPSLRSRTFEVENHWPPRDSIICSNADRGSVPAEKGRRSGAVYNGCRESLHPEYKWCGSSGGYGSTSCSQRTVNDQHPELGGADDGF
jgi:hypothetical protein